MDLFNAGVLRGLLGMITAEAQCRGHEECWQLHRPEWKEIPWRRGRKNRSGHGKAEAALPACNPSSCMNLEKIILT